MPHRAPPIIDVVLLDELLRAEGPVAVAGGELERLRAAGCEFDAHPRHGIRLLRSGLGAWVDYLHFRLGEHRRVVCYRRTASTQDAARRLIAGARADDMDGAVVAADEQTGGRGRLGRRWIAPPGTAVLVSRVVPGRSNIDRLTFAASVAVARALETLLGSGGEVAIKWPNDVLIDGRKVAGVLVEAVQAGGERFGVVGIGVNTHVTPRHLPAELRPRVTSLAMLGRHVDRLRVLADVMQAVDHALVEPQETLLDHWRTRCHMLRRRITLRHAGRDIAGEVIDLDPQDGLILRRDSGEIVHLPAATTTVVG